MEHFFQFLTTLGTIYIFVILCAFIYILTKGADMAIDGAVALARSLKLSPMVIGATIVSIGTTMPETFVSVMAAWSNEPGLALGNGVGSIIADTGLILGFCLLISKVPIDRFILNRTGWIQVFAATLLVFISVTQAFLFKRPVLDRWVGILFLVLLVGYLYLTYMWSKQLSHITEDTFPQQSTLKGIFYIAIGLFAVIVSSKILVVCAQELARRIGVPEDVIAATMVALGTSLPELTTAITAVRKGYPQIMVGNIVGADVLNCFFVIGASIVATPLKIPDNFFFLHYPTMLLILFSLRFFISINRKKFFPRWQGAWLVFIYLVYIFVQYK